MRGEQIPRRVALKRLLVGGVYATPIVAASAIVFREVAAVSAAPLLTVGTVTFVNTGGATIARGTGFPANAPFLLVASNADGSVAYEAAVHTNEEGAFNPGPAPTATPLVSPTTVPRGPFSGPTATPAATPLISPTTAPRGPRIPIADIGPCTTQGVVNGGVIFVSLSAVAGCQESTPTATARGGAPTSSPATQTAIAARTATAGAAHP